MKVKTYLFGEIDINEDKIITFPNGLIGEFFEGKTKFTLIHEDDQNPHNFPTYTLQSIEDGEYALQIVDPTMFGFHYELELTDEEEKILKNPKSEDVVFMQTVYRLPQSEGQTPIKKVKGSGLATNLRAPLIINVKERVGIQKLIEKVNTNVIFSNLTEEIWICRFANLANIFYEISKKFFGFFVENLFFYNLERK